MFVVRSEAFDNRSIDPSPIRRATSSLVLQSLDEPDALVRFDSFVSRGDAQAADGEVYQLLFGVMGSLSVQPAFAVCAEWEVGSSDHHAAFEDSRQLLFELRRQNLPTFVFDWLLKRVDREGQYLALGLYGDEEGLQLCQSHPEIQQFDENHPPASYTATDLSGVRFYRVEQPSPQ